MTKNIVPAASKETKKVWESKTSVEKWAPLLRFTNMIEPKGGEKKVIEEITEERWEPLYFLLKRALMLGFVPTRPFAVKHVYGNWYKAVC